uniref:Uncharacterized protein LOC114342410 n=1 Tax=Diabrotica virgifera virgifera TaxID=50390 RepID=A0A6P7GGV7_DIAVI
MKELVEIEHIKEDTWVAFLTEIFKKENEKSLPETPNKIKYQMNSYNMVVYVQQLQLLIHKIIATNRIPDEWRRAIMLRFFKKGDKKDPNNYRAINLLNTTLKLTTRIIATKINERITARGAARISDRKIIMHGYVCKPVLPQFPIYLFITVAVSARFVLVCSVILKFVLKK